MIVGGHLLGLVATVVVLLAVLALDATASLPTTSDPHDARQGSDGGQRGDSGLPHGDLAPDGRERQRT